MMKSILLGLLLASGASQAQVTLPPCIPGITGKSAAFIPEYKEGTIANHLYWKCVDPKDSTKNKIYGISCLKETCSKETFAQAIKTVTGASSKVTTAKRLYKETVTKECTPITEKEDSPFGKMCAERAALSP